jgi:hypothetical protein
LGHILLFWKVTMQAFQKTPNFQWITTLKKKIGGGSLCTGGTARIWAMHIFSTSYFDQISIFGLSKDQTFRIWSTFMNPEQFLILVPYLLLVQIQKRKKCFITVLPRLCQPRLCEFPLKNFPIRFGYVNSFVYIFSIISSLHRENKKFYTKNMYVCVSCVSLISIFDYFNFGYFIPKNLK